MGAGSTGGQDSPRHFSLPSPAHYRPPPLLIQEFSHFSASERAQGVHILFRWWGELNPNRSLLLLLYPAPHTPCVLMICITTIAAVHMEFPRAMCRLETRTRYMHMVMRLWLLGHAVSLYSPPPVAAPCGGRRPADCDGDKEASRGAEAEWLHGTDAGIVPLSLVGLVFLRLVSTLPAARPL